MLSEEPKAHVIPGNETEIQLLLSALREPAP
jgi:hypothetical protein